MSFWNFRMFCPIEYIYFSSCCHHVLNFVSCGKNIINIIRTFSNILMKLMIYFFFFGWSWASILRRWDVKSSQGYRNLSSTSEKNISGDVNYVRWSWWSWLLMKLLIQSAKTHTERELMPYKALVNMPWIFTKHIMA